MLLCLLLAVCLPVTAMATPNSAELRVGSSDLSGEGFAYTASTGTLELNNYSNTAGIQMDGDTVIMLTGENTINMTAPNGTTCAEALYSAGSLTIGGNGKLTITMNMGTQNCEVGLVGIMVQKNLVIQDGAQVVIDIKGGVDSRTKGVWAKNGVKVQDSASVDMDVVEPNNVTVSNPIDVYGVYADNGEIAFSGTSKVNIDVVGTTALYAKSNVSISDNADVAISGGTDSAVNAADILVNGKKLTIVNAINGLKALNGIQIKNTEVDVTVDVTGIYVGKDITMENSKVSSVAKDVNAIRTTDGKVTITKTTLTAKGGQDGIYAKDDVTITNSAENAVNVEGVQYGIFTNGDVKVAGGTLSAKSTSNSEDYCAISAKKFEVEAAQIITASTKYYGTLGTYYESKIGTYDYISVSEIADIWVDDVPMYDGDYLKDDAVETTKTKPADNYAYYNNGVLTLHNFSCEGIGHLYDNKNGYAAIYAVDVLEIVLEGTSTVVATHNTYDPHGITGADSVTISGDGTLKLQADKYGISSVSGNVTVESGTLNVTAGSDGIHSAVDAAINGGTVDIDANGNGIYSDNNAAIAGGTVTIDAAKDGVYAIKEVAFNGGNATVVGGKNGLNAGSKVKINSSGLVVKSDSVAAEDGNYCAINSEASNGFSYDSKNLTLTAATSPNGILDKYVSGNHKEYDYIKVEKTPAIWVGGIGLFEGDYLKQGASSTTTTNPGDKYAHYADGKLTLNNFSYTGVGLGYGDGKYAAIYSDKEFTLELVGSNTLKATNDTVNPSGIYAGSNLTVSGTGTLTITAEDQGIVAKGNVTAVSGTVNVTVPNYGIDANSKKITVSGGVLTIDAKDAVRAKEVVAESGSVTVTASNIGVAVTNLTITGGNVTVTATNNGINASNITINDGNLTVTADGIGINASANITIEKGNVKATAKKDGIFTKGDITVSGGNVTVTAIQDGIDATNITINDGTIIVKSTNTESDDGYQAVRASGTLTIAKTMTTMASVDPDGTLGWYDKAKIATYDYVKITGTPAIWVGNVGLYEGDYLKQGESAPTTEKLSDNYACFNEGKLTLKNFSYTGNGHEYKNSTYAGIYSANNELTLELVGTNALNVQSETVNPAGIYVAKNLIISGSGSLTIKADTVGIRANSGTMTITGATLDVTAGQYGIYSSGNCTVSDSANITIKAETNGIWSNSGIVAVKGSSLNITANKIGIRAEENCSMEDSTVSVTAGESGIVSNTKDVTVVRGTVTVTAVQNAIQAANNVSAGGTVIAKSTNETDDAAWQAISFGQKFIVDSGLSVYASTEPNGTLGEYDQEKHDQYDLIQVNVTPSYTLTVQNGSGGGTHKQGATVNISADVPDGAVFDKWVVVTSGVEVSFGKETDAVTTMTMPGANVTIKATFKYKVTVTDGTADPAVVAPGATVTIKANDPATCKAFDKWIVNIGTVTLADSTKTTTTFTMPESAVKITAAYKDAHTGGTATCLKKAVCEVCKNEYGSLGDHDYAEAWNYKESAGHAHKCELCEAHSTVVAHEYTDKSDASCNTCGYVRILDAVIYTVKFEANGGTGTMESMKVEDGKEYTLPENAFTAPEGKQFKGWKIGETEKKPGDKITVTADVTVTAVWEDIPVVTYTVTFAANGGTGTMEAVKVETGKEYTLPENGFTAPDGKQFKCWKLDDVDLKVGDKITVTSDVTVTAVWEDIPAVTYTVTFDANGGSGTMEAATVEAGKEYELPENKFTAPEGKQFKGWKIGETEKKPGDKITVSADITVTAVWEEIHVCDLKEVAKVEPTCTEPGKEAYYHCDGCNKNFEDKEGTKEIADLDAYGVIEATGHNFVDGVCTKCGAEDPDAATIIRISGSSRYKTAYEIADKLKEVLGVETFDSIVVAYGRGFPDALAGSYLATEKNAPILLVEKNVEKEVIAYIKANLSAKGTVYILGGTSSVPESFANGLKAENIAYKRLAGDNRYLTNLEILKEAELNSKTILVCTGKNFADSLSASAVNLPILLVGDSLTKEQKAYFENIENLTFQIIGGTGSVSESVANELKAFGNVARIAGSTREITSVEVAKAFFKEPEIVTLAYSRDFPDGLCGGPLAYNLGAPLLLVNEGTESYAAEYVKANGIEAGIVFGGTATISDKTAIAVFAK